MNKEEYIKKLKDKLIEFNRGRRYEKICVEYAERLIDNGLPVIYDLNHFSLLVGMKSHDISKLLFINEKLIYKKIKILKKLGGYRNLVIPTENIKYLQKWILENILNKIKISEYATGFVKGKSIFQNAEEHINKNFIMNIDLKDFFPSINQERVFKIFNYYGYTKELSYIFSKICTYEGVLPQGAPTSPYISNICCLKLDKRISSLCRKNDFKYSRYADDITISSDSKTLYFLKLLSKIIEEEGFKINDKKTRILKKSDRQEITGLVINSGIVKIPKAYKRKIYSEMYFCKKYGVANHLNKINCKKSFYKEHLYGKVFYVNMVEPKEAQKMFKTLEEIQWEY